MLKLILKKSLGIASATFANVITGKHKGLIKEFGTRKNWPKEKMQDLNAIDLNGAMNMVKGSAVSMGMEVVG